MKKRIITVTALIMLVCIMAVAFTACSQTESEYYADIEKSVSENAPVCAQLYENLAKANFKTSFNFYRNYSDTAIRGSETKEGGTQKYVNEEGKEVTDWIVDYGYIEYVQNTSSEYFYKMTLYKGITEAQYDKLSKGKEVEGIDDNKIETTVTLKDGVMKIDGAVAENVIDGLDLLGVPREIKADNSLGVTNGNKIYTHIMQVSERVVYLVGDENTNIETLSGCEVVTKAQNDAATEKYWNNFGEDITYDWTKVGGMINTRNTYSYSKKHMQINQIDLYSETVLSYYTPNNILDTTLVLKAKVFDMADSVINIEYPKEGESFQVPVQ